MATASIAAFGSAADDLEGHLRTASPACAVELAEPDHAAPRLRVRVGARELDLGATDQPPEELRVHAGGHGAVLLAYRGSDGDTPYGGSTLWRVPCDRGPAEPFVAVEGADFGHSVLSADGQTLFYSGPDGVYSLDLTSRAMRRLTRAKSDYCAENEVHARDVVMGLDGKETLRFERGCRYEFSWNAEAMQIENVGAARVAVVGAPRPPFTAIGVDAGGGLWLSDGLCNDPTTSGRVLFSADRGEHWRSIAIRTGRDVVEQPIRQLIADRSLAGSVLFFTASCGSAAHVDPAWIFVTEDGGKTTRPIAVPPGIAATDDGTPESEQDPLAAIEAPDGSLSHLVLYGASEQVVGALVARWESRDAGRSWTALEPVPAAPKLAERSSVATGEWEFSIRKDGLYRARRGEPAQRIQPRE